MKYETVLNWLCIQFAKKEDFWSDLKKDAGENKLDIYEYSLCQIAHENVHESFYRLKDKSCIAIRKQRTKLFVSDSFQNRTKGYRYGKIVMKMAILIWQFGTK
jgi:hypothetical protein